MRYHIPKGTEGHRSGCVNFPERAAFSWQKFTSDKAVTYSQNELLTLDEMLTLGISFYEFWLPEAEYEKSGWARVAFFKTDVELI
jgi:hypothetical protein